MPDQPTDDAAPETRRTAAQVLRDHQLTPSVTVDDGKLTIFGKTPMVLFRRVCALVFAAVTIFGGWGAASDDVPSVGVGEPIDAGQFTITIRSAVATIPPPTDDEALAYLNLIELTIVADTKLTDDKGTSGGSSVLSIADIDTQTTIATSVLDARDSTPLTINPGQSIRTQYAWSLPRSVARDDLPDTVTVDVNKMTWSDSLPISGYAGWIAGDPAAQVTLPLDIRTGTQ